MSPHCVLRRSVLAPVAVSALLASAAHADLLTFTGSTPNWFAPSNWDGGRVPGADDDVLIGGGRTVVIDPALGPAEVTFRDITITGDATLETLPGTIYTSRNETLDDGNLIHRSTRAFDTVGDFGTLRVLPCSGFTCGGIKFNPTPKTKRDIVLQSSVTFGLGGATAASNLVSAAFGAGHYATLTTDNATLGGTLDLELFYGFTPTLGQSFQIINVGMAGPGSGTRTGQFDGLGEGAFVKGFRDVGLYISYAGGNGNDVVLTAAAIPTPAAATVLGLGGLIATRRRRENAA
jgi:hypothetical protein